MNEIKSSFRKLRMIQVMVIGLVLAGVSVAELTSSRTNSQWSLQHWLMAGLAVLCGAEGFNFHNRFLPCAAQALRKDRNNSGVCKRWELWNVMSLAMAGTVPLYGSVVRIVLRGTFWQALPFYSVGIILLLLWTPRMPIRDG